MLEQYDAFAGDADTRREAVMFLLDSGKARFHHADWNEPVSPLGRCVIESDNIQEPKKMFLHRAITAVIEKALYDSRRRNYARRTHTSKYTQQVTSQSLILATVSIKHALQNWASGEYIRTAFDADAHKGMSQ